MNVRLSLPAAPNRTGRSRPGPAASRPPGRSAVFCHRSEADVRREVINGEVWWEAAAASERLIHYKRVDVARLRMLECTRKLADNLKPKPLPKPYGALVRADDEIELHGSIAT